MRDIFVVLVHSIVTVVRLIKPGGLRAVVAESALTRHQLLILNRSRKRAPSLRCSSSKVHRGRGWRWEIRGAHGTTATLGLSTAVDREFRTQRNVSEAGDRIARLETLPDRHLRCRGPSVPVMQTADSLLCPGGANYIRLRFGRPSARRLLIQSDMSSVVVIIANIFEAEPFQMSLVQRDHVIQHLTAYAPHPSFRDSVLPRTANACPDSFDPARFQKAEHFGAELAITIKDDVAVWAWKRQGLSELL